MSCERVCNGAYPQPVNAEEQTARQRKEMDEKMAAIEKKLADTTEEYESSRFG